MLTRLEAHHYRCFERLGIDMGNFCVIVGTNGSGKTTLLDIPVLLGELFRADNIASVFLVSRGEKPARTNRQGNGIIAAATNLPWLALDLKLSGLAADATPEQKQSYRSRDYRDWVDHVITALPQVSDIDIRVREEDQFAYFSVRYRAGHSVTSSDLSDGTLRILGLTLLAWVRNAPGLLVTEEPENGIHPGAIATILESLASFYDSQVWVTSHSPVVLASSELPHLLCARQTEAGGIEIIAGTQHPSLQHWRGDMNLGMLFATGILG